MFDKTKKSLRVYMILTMASIILLIAVGFVTAIYFVNERSEKESLSRILQSEVDRVEGFFPDNNIRFNGNIQDGEAKPFSQNFDGDKAHLQKPNEPQFNNNLFLGTNSRRMYVSVIVKNDGSVENFKVNIPFDDEVDNNYEALIETVDGKEKGKVTFENNYYIFDSEETSKGRIYVFVDSTINRKFLNTSILVGLLVAIASIVYMWLLSIKITNKALYPLKLSVESQLRFSSDASHELRTPLTAMRANMDILLEYEDLTFDEQKKWLTNISKEIDRMSKLTNDLLKLSRNNTVEREFKEFNSLNLVDYIEFMYKNICELRFNVDEFNIYANEEELKQLLIIFIDNGLKYNKSENKIIDVSIENKDRHNVFVIKDNGVGIKEENFEKIFERFFREDKARTSNQNGLGLGLSIANNIIKSYGGKIKVNSKMEKYTEFVIILPKQKY